MTPLPFLLLVTGSRRLRDFGFVAGELDRLLARRLPHVRLIHGACHLGGADALADRWAAARGIDRAPYPVEAAEWKRLGKAAGPKRNAAMADRVQAAHRGQGEYDGRPGMGGAVAFRAFDSTGTTDCVGRCVMAGVPLVVIDVTLDDGGMVTGHTVKAYNRGR